MNPSPPSGGADLHFDQAPISLQFHHRQNNARRNRRNRRTVASWLFQDRRSVDNSGSRSGLSGSRIWAAVTVCRRRIGHAGPRYRRSDFTRNRYRGIGWQLSRLSRYGAEHCQKHCSQKLMHRDLRACCVIASHLTSTPGHAGATAGLARCRGGGVIGSLSHSRRSGCTRPEGSWSRPGWRRGSAKALAERSFASGESTPFESAAPPRMVWAVSMAAADGASGMPARPRPRADLPGGFVLTPLYHHDIPWCHHGPQHQER